MSITRGDLDPLVPPARQRVLVLALMAAGLVATSAPVAAQSTAAATETQALEAVVITAGKREEKQREVAGTVSVIQGSDLERRGARDQEDAFKLTPGVQINKGDPSSNAITIRGIGTSGCSICGGAVQSPAGLYLEDVPITDPYGVVQVVDIAAFDLERIEVLRGPQGALYGSSSLGGAIRYLLGKPSFRSVEASVLGSVNHVSGGGAGYSAFGMVNVPIGDGKAALRVVAFDRKDSGYIDNLGAGQKDANELRQRGGRVMFSIKPTKEFSATVVAMTQETENDDRFGVSPDPNRLEQSTPTLSPRSARFDFANLRLDYDLGAHTLTSNTGWWKKALHAQPDSTALFGNIGVGFGLPPLPVVTTPGDATFDSITQELRIASNPGGRLSYVAGVFYQGAEYDATSTILAPGGQALWGALGPTLLPNDVMSDSAASAKTTEKAVFFDGEYAIGGGWSAGLGGRYYRTTVRFDTVATFLGSPFLAPSNSGETNGFTPKATVKYRFGDDNLWYALVSKGYRFGGVNGAPPFRPYDSDSLVNYETGVRLNPAKDLQLDLTLFVLDWTKAQVPGFDVTGPVPLLEIRNVGKARSTGVEVAAQYRVTAALDVAAAIAYTDAKTTTDLASGAIPGNTIPSGSRLPSTPRLQTALQGNLRFAGPFESYGRFSATHTYVGSRVMDIDGINKAGSYSTLDFGLSFVRDNWTLSSGIANALDKRGVVGLIGGLPSVPFTDYYIQRPRTVSVSLRYDH